MQSPAPAQDTHKHVIKHIYAILFGSCAGAWNCYCPQRLHQWIGLGKRNRLQHMPLQYSHTSSWSNMSSLPSPALIAPSLPSFSPCTSAAQSNPYLLWCAGASRMIHCQHILLVHFSNVLSGLFVTVSVLAPAPPMLVPTSHNSILSSHWYSNRNMTRVLRSTFILKHSSNWSKGIWLTYLRF